VTAVLPRLLDVTPNGEDLFTGPAAGPPDKRAYGGHLAAQAHFLDEAIQVLLKLPAQQHHVVDLGRTLRQRWRRLVRAQFGRRIDAEPHSLGVRG